MVDLRTIKDAVGDMKNQLASGGLREFLNRNSAVVTIGAVVLLMVSLGLLFLQMNGSSPRSITETYYYNLNSGELFPGSLQEFGSISPPDGSTYAKFPWGAGPAGVRAFVFSCTDCSDESSRFVGYVETVPPAVAEKLKSVSASTDQSSPEVFYQAESQTIIMSPEDPQKRWLPQMTPQAQQLISQITQRCTAGQSLKMCYPD